MKSTSNERHEVVVVGSRCAGAATAMLLAQQGIDVVTVDRARFPSDTLSTHSVSRGGVVQLQRWGHLRFCATTTTGDDRRHILDDILLRAAERAGALRLRERLVEAAGVGLDPHHERAAPRRRQTCATELEDMDRAVEPLALGLDPADQLHGTAEVPGRPVAEPPDGLGPVLCDRITRGVGHG